MANSNTGPCIVVDRLDFRISYPTGWVIVPPRGANVPVSFNPPKGAGNCNVIVRPNAELKGMTQAALNREIQTLPIDQSVRLITWAFQPLRFAWSKPDMLAYMMCQRRWPS